MSEVKDFILAEPDHVFIRVDTSRRFKGANPRQYYLWMDNDGRLLSTPTPLSIGLAQELLPMAQESWPPPQYSVEIVRSTSEAQEPKDFIMGQPRYVTVRVTYKPQFGLEPRWLNTAGGLEWKPARLSYTDAFHAKEYYLRHYGAVVDTIVIEPAEDQSQMFWQGRRWPEDFSESELEEALEEPKDFIMGQNVPFVIRMRYKWQAQSIPWQYWCYAGFKYVEYLDNTEIVPYPDKAMAEQSLRTRHFGDDQIVEIVPWTTLMGEKRVGNPDEVEEGADPKQFIMQQQPRYVVRATYLTSWVGGTVIYVRNSISGVDWTPNLWEAQRFGGNDAQRILNDLNQKKAAGHFESIKEFSLVLLESLHESKKETLIGSVVAVWKNKVALVKGKKHWTLPAGRTKDSESVFHAAARECQEESGLKIKAADLIFVGLIKRSKHKSDSIFAVRLDKEQTLVAGSDAKEAMWFSLDKLPKLAFGHGVAIKKALRVLKMKPEERGQLVAFEGVDGSGKSTQVELTVDWLKEQGYPVIQTKWNSSPLVSPAIKQGKKEKQLSPMLYHLLHSADLLHRYEQIVVPALARNFVVVCDRYWPTGIVRDRLRGVKDKSAYAKLRKPDVLFYCAVQPEEAVKRLVKAGRLSWYGIGMDLNYADDEQDNALEYTKRMKTLYARSLPSRHVPLNCNRKVGNIFKDIQSRVTRVLDRHYFHAQNVHERAEALVANLLETQDPKDFIMGQRAVIFNIVGTDRQTGQKNYYAHGNTWTPEPPSKAWPAWRGGATAANNWVEIVKGNWETVYDNIHAEIEVKNPLEKQKRPKDFIMGQRPVIFNIVGTHRESPHNQLYLQWNGLFGSFGPAVWRGGAEQADRWVQLSQGSHEALYRDIHMVPEVKYQVAEAEAKNFIMKAKQPKFRIRGVSTNPQHPGRPIWLAHYGDSLRWAYRREEGVVYSAKLADERLRAINQRIPWSPSMLEIADESVTEAGDPKAFILKQRAPSYTILALYAPTGKTLYWSGSKGRHSMWSESRSDAVLFRADKVEKILDQIKQDWGEHDPLIGGNYRDIRAEPEAVTEAADPKGFIDANAPDTFRVAGTDDEGAKRWLTSLTTQNDAWSSYEHQSSLFTWEEAQEQLKDLEKCQWIRDIHIRASGRANSQGRLLALEGTMKTTFKLPRRARALLEGSEPREFIDANAPQLFRVVAVSGRPENSSTLYHSQKGWLPQPHLAGSYTFQRANELAKWWTDNQLIKDYLRDIKTEPVLEAQEPRDFIDANVPELFHVICTDANGLRYYHGRWDPYVKGQFREGWFEEPRAAKQYTYLQALTLVKHWQKREAEPPGTEHTWVRSPEMLPLAEAQDPKDPKDFILAQNPPRTWGELKIGDVLFGEDGAVRVITKQMPSGGYAMEATTLYDEYSPAYAYTEHGGPFVQHLTRDASDELLGEYVIGTAKELGPDFWTLMKREIAKQHPEHAREHWPEIFEASAKDFIMAQRPRSPWAVKSKACHKGAFVEHRTQIFFEGEAVAVVWSMYRPPVARWRADLQKLHQSTPFDESKQGFWQWLSIQHNRTFGPRGFTSIREAMEPKDFIVQLPSVEQVCKDFGMHKTGDEYQNGDVLWPGGSSHTTRFQSFKMMLPLSREITREFEASLKELEVSVVYSEEEYSPSNILYYARIDVGISGRSKRLHSDDEVKLATWVERYLRRLKLALKTLRTTRSGQLQRVLARTGFTIRESTQQDEELKKLMEGADPKQFILDAPTVEAVCAKWQLKLTGNYTTPNPDTEHWHYKGSMRMQRPVLVTASDPPQEKQYVHVTVHYSVTKFKNTAPGRMESSIYHHIKLATDVTWASATTIGDMEAVVAERLDLAIFRFQKALWASHAKTDDALRKSLHRFLARGWPK